MKFIYNSGRHRQSGTSMQKHRPPSQQARLDAVRKVLPGFPSQPFTRIEDIEAYVGGNVVACLICGKPYRKLMTHVKRIHQLDEVDYRNRFNIPAKYPLCSVDISLACRTLVASREDENLEHLREIRKLGVEARKHGLDPKNAVRTTFSSEQARINIAKVAPGSSRRKTNCIWHLEQCRAHRYYKGIVPPAGELSWSGFKKRCRADPELAARFRAAREQWRFDETTRPCPQRQKRQSAKSEVIDANSKGWQDE